MPDRAANRPNSPHPTAWLLVIAQGFLWLFPMLPLRGMSLDGVIYATISRNMALGLGDAWHLVYTATKHSFRDSPPLAMLLQSLYFRALGDHWWVERLYSVSTVLPTGCILVLIWRHLLARSPERQAFAWLSVALWVSLPAWPWIYRNNYLENTLGIFTALAVYGSLRAMASRRWWAAWTALAAGSIGAAVLSKGPVGLFPLVTPAIVWLTLGEQSFRKTLLVQLTLVVGLAAGVAWLLTQTAPREFLTVYFQEQVVYSLQGRRELVESPLGQLSLLWTLVVNDLLLSAAMAGACVLWARRRGFERREGGLGGPIGFCLLSAASASIPIMISPKQSAYYAAPSWPLYTMALALWCLPSVEALMAAAIARASAARATWWLRSAALATMGLLVAVSPLWAGRFYRDRQIFHDVEQIARVVGPHATVVMPTAMVNEWSLHAYLYRLHYISVKITDAVAPGAYHLDFANSKRPLPDDCTRADADMQLYRLYKPASSTALRGDAAWNR